MDKVVKLVGGGALRSAQHACFPSFFLPYLINFIGTMT